MCAGVEPCESILTHWDTNHSVVSLARANTPTRITSIIQEAGKHKATRLDFWSGCENSNEHSKGVNGIPPDGNIIQVFKEVGPECISQTCKHVPSAGNQRGSILQNLPWLTKTTA